jgi:uncharacterized protein (UPF0332 family)
VTPTESLARVRIARARATLDDADALIEGKRWNGALNRLYYAVFYAARALLATQNLDSSRHSGVISLFQQHFVRTGRVPQETARALPRLFEKRQTTDYGDYSEATRDEVASLRVQAEGFLHACEDILRPHPT